MFIAVAFALAWLVALPLWFGDGLASSWFLLVAVAVMTTPAIAALVVVFFVERPQEKGWTLGLWPLGPARRLFGYAALRIVVPIALVLMALPIGALLGVCPADAEITHEMHITEATVKTHLLHVFGKLEVSDRTAAVTVARDSGLL